MLTKFFKTNKTDPLARHLNLLYKEFPKHFVWDSEMRFWKYRKKGAVIGRLTVINSVENERYYLRILLNNVRCPTSYQDLLTFEEVVSESFQDDGYMRVLLHNDNDTDKTTEEASTYRMPTELRRLFATLLQYCRPSNAKKLFETYYEQMAEDFRRLHIKLNLSEQDVQHKVLQGFNDTLESLGKNVNEYHLVSFKYVASEFERFTREITAEKNIHVQEEDLLAIKYLNTRQKYAFDIIFKNAMKKTGEVFFVDGPGGTGKVFFYKVLFAHIQSKGYVGLSVSFSGIASSCFLHGRTAHSRFKIPIDAGPEAKCHISYQSSEANLIRCAKITIWDETLMVDKRIILALDKLLQDLCQNVKTFGGKLVVFGGDFRQIPSIVKGWKERTSGSKYCQLHFVAAL